jgi:broad specificity phosphatase PhoE
MRYLILVRHSLPEVVPAVPGYLWQLSAEGRTRCRLLAEQLSSYQPASIVSSVEPKAAETAALLSAHLHIPYKTVEGLHEHERGNVPYLGKEAWAQTVAAFFAQPDELVFGKETATQAFQRFNASVQQVQQQEEGNIVIVAHGTVISLFVAHYTDLQPLLFWRSLDTPAFVVLSVPDYSLVNVVPRLDMPSR